ncbi:MAG: hypothetical protein EHM41_00720 [Chloroflexi bacterium]|nr:MAG: hypothetical protein EHM41_00720 [Chloroflexota bacterium]
MQKTATASSPSVLSFLPASIFLMLTGWGGLAAVIYMFPPLVWPRWAFFFFGVLACTGTALPVVAFLNRRFPSNPPPTPGVIMRQAAWFGVYFPMLAWLRWPRLLTPTLALLLAFGLLLIEWLLRLRENSQWRP